MKLAYIEKLFGFGSGECRGNSDGSEETLSSFSIVPRVYEAELDDKYGISLGALRKGEASGFRGNLEKNVFFSRGLNHSIRQIEDRILKKYEGVPGFCSMNVEDEGQLWEHVRNIHELSYSHYVFGKEKSMRGSFPDSCCTRSSINLFLTLMERGYPNASVFLSGYGRHGHVYVGLPFVFGEKQEKGFVIADPTSDQLFDDKKNAPRNSIFVAPGAKWEYKTDWAYGADLFPGSDNGSKFANLHTLRTIQASPVHGSMGVEKYFGEVFKNPVDVDVEGF